MRCLLEIATPDSGELTVLGAAPSAATRRLVGYMPEERGLYPKMTAARQIAYFAQLNGAGTADANERALALLARLGLSDRGDEPVEKLSLGNQQRVHLAVALAHEPRLLILDEVPRQEELQNVTTPLTLLLIGSCLLAFPTLDNPSSLILSVLSFVPPFSVLTMPIRLASGSAGPISDVVSGLVLVAAILLITAPAARVYARSVLATGARVSLRQALFGPR